MATASAAASESAPMDLEKKAPRRLRIDSESEGDDEDNNDKDDRGSTNGIRRSSAKNSTTEDATDEAKLEPQSSSTTSNAVVVSPPARTTSSGVGSSQELFSPELLHQYYSRLFPFDLLCSWLSYSPSNNGSASSNNNNNNNKSLLPTTTTPASSSLLFSRREFSMTIEPSPGDEIYIRYQSFANQKELTDAILKRRPVKIDLGAIFSHPPKDHKSVPKSAFGPVQRELVFDIDLTDYDSVRACGCAGAAICHKCWEFMKMAVSVLDEGLRDDFGFRHVAWFYSGRRGVHCWVCDENARELTDAGRSAVASYFEVGVWDVRGHPVLLGWRTLASLHRLTLLLC
jgi:DNA primase small subunit